MSRINRTRNFLLIATSSWPAVYVLNAGTDAITQVISQRGSRISVTSFFGRRSSRTSVNSNVSVASSNLTSITEDRKKSIINGTNKKVFC